MKVRQKGIFVFVPALLLFCISAIVVPTAVASSTLVWEAQVSSSGAEVVSPVLESGAQYRIVAEDAWVYNNLSNLAADAQYYTTNYSDTWMWGNHFRPPNNESFLQIDQQNVDWGPFSNGDTNHTYAMYYVGEGKTIKFNIHDWNDTNYGNNYCHLDVKIYEELTVGGYVVEPRLVNVLASWTVSLSVLAVMLAVPVCKYCKTRRRA